jgi:hypothetical protein
MLSEFGYEITDKGNDEAWDPTDYKILYENSGDCTFGRESSQATVAYMVEYFDVGQFIDVVLGKTVLDGGGLRRSAASPDFDGSQGSLPEPHPWVENLYAATASVAPSGRVIQVGGRPVYQKARVTVSFRPVDYNVISDADYDADTEVDRFVSKVPEGSAEFQTSQGLFRFVTDPQKRPLDIQPGFVVAAQRFVYTWHQIPVATRDDGQPDLGRVPNIDTILPLVGAINSLEFDGFAPGTVLFSSFSPKLVLPQLAGPDSYYWDISYTLGVRDYGASPTPVLPGESIGWNYAYDPTRHIWDLYTDTGTTGGKTMYSYSNLNVLFTVTW